MLFFHGVSHKNPSPLYEPLMQGGFDPPQTNNLTYKIKVISLNTTKLKLLDSLLQENSTDEIVFLQ